MGRWPSFSRSPLDSGSRRPAAPSRPLTCPGISPPSRCPSRVLGDPAGVLAAAWGSLPSLQPVGRGVLCGRESWLARADAAPSVGATGRPASLRGCRPRPVPPRGPRPAHRTLLALGGSRSFQPGRGRVLADAAEAGREAGGAGPPPPEADPGRTFTSSARASHPRYASVEHPVPAPPRGCAALLQGRGGARSVRPGGACGRRRLRPCPGVGLLSGCDGPAGGDPVPVPVRAVGGPRPGSVPGGVAARAALLAGPAAPAPPASPQPAGLRTGAGAALAASGDVATVRGFSRGA